MHRIYFLREGTFTDSSMDVDKYTREELEEIKNSYDPKLFEAPIVIGHKEDIEAIYQDDTAPAYGWIKSIGLDESGLYADAKLAEEFEVLLDKEAPPFKHISAAIYEADNPFNPKEGQKYIRHIAFLGAQPPAIKGLPEVVKINAYSDSLLNTSIVFNNNIVQNISNIEKINMDDTKKVKKYSMPTEEVVEDLDTYAEEVKLPDPETASVDEIKTFLKENAVDFITYILKEGEYGYPGDISGFGDEPSEDNNYLFNSSKNAFEGVFYDDESGEVDGFNFKIFKSGGSWYSSYIPVNQEDAEDTYTEEYPAPTAEELNPEPEPEPEQEVEMEVEEYMEEEVPEVLSTTDEASLAKGELEKEEKEEVLEEEASVSVIAELELMKSEAQNLRNEVLKLRNELIEVKLKEYKEYAEKLTPYTDMDKDKLGTLLFQIDKSTERAKLHKAYSELYNKDERPIVVLKGILDQVVEKAKIRVNTAPVTYGEFMPEENMEEEEVIMDSPVGTVYSEEGVDIHKKVLAYCSKNNLDAKKPEEYLVAYKAVSK